MTPPDPAQRPSRLALVALIASNLIPLVGVAAFGWSVRSLMLLYWAENIVVAFYAVLRMVKVGGLVALPTAAFFCIHFGIFTVVHGVFVFTLTAPNGPLGGAAVTADSMPWLAVLGLLASHGVSFVVNFLIGGEWRTSNITLEMGKPYPRMIILHVAIVIGAFFVMALGQPAALLILLVMLKTGLDVVVHLTGHRMRMAVKPLPAPAAATSLPQ